MPGKNFVDSALETIKGHVSSRKRTILFLDSDAVETLPAAERAEFVRDKLGEYDPKLKKMSNPALLQSFEGLKAAGPAAVDLSGKFNNVCMIQKPDSDFNSKADMISALTGLADNRFKPMPGTDQDYMNIIAHHEAEHCNQFESGQTGKSGYDTFKREIGGDQEAIDHLRRAGKNDIANALMDLRSISALTHENGDPTHATAILIDHKNIPKEAFEGAEKLRPAADAAVGERLDAMGLQELHRYGLDDIDHADRPGVFLGSHPDAYMHMLKESSADGAFDHGNPYTKQYIDAATAAWDRRGTPDAPLPPAMPLKNLLESNVKYVTVAIAMEDVKKGEKLSAGDRADVNRIMTDPGTPHEVLDALKTNYGKELKPFTQDPQEAAPAAPAMQQKPTLPSPVPA